MKDRLLAPTSENLNLKISLKAKSIDKNFGSYSVLENINFEVSGGEGLVITGANGSGKSTLVKILCGLLRPTSGEAAFYIDDKQVPADKIQYYYGLVSPELRLYDELTASENITFFNRLRCGSKNSDTDGLLSRFGLEGRGDEPVKSDSSGMKQRLKYIKAMLHRPEVLFLDEPTANLDSEGIELVNNICGEQKSGGVLIVATNDKRDFDYGEKIIRLPGSGSRNIN